MKMRLIQSFPSGAAPEKGETRIGPRLDRRHVANPVAVTLDLLYDTRFLSETPHEGPVNTFSGYRPRNGCLLDYIFTTGNVRVLRHATCSERPGGIHPSDHDAVMARVEIQ